VVALGASVFRFKEPPLPFRRSQKPPATPLQVISTPPLLYNIVLSASSEETSPPHQSKLLFLPSVGLFFSGLILFEVYVVLLFFSFMWCSSWFYGICGVCKMSVSFRKWEPLSLSLSLSPISCFGRQEQNKFESLINLWFLFFVLFSKILRFNGKENYWKQHLINSPLIYLTFFSSHSLDS